MKRFSICGIRSGAALDIFSGSDLGPPIPQGGELKAHQCQSVCRWVQAHLGPLRIQLQS